MPDKSRGSRRKRTNKKSNAGIKEIAPKIFEETSNENEAMNGEGKPIVEKINETAPVCKSSSDDANEVKIFVESASKEKEIIEVRSNSPPPAPSPEKSPKRSSDDSEEITVVKVVSASNSAKKQLDLSSTETKPSDFKQLTNPPLNSTTISVSSPTGNPTTKAVKPDAAEKKKPPKKKKEPVNSVTLDNYFPRIKRVPTSQLKNEKEVELSSKILSCCQEGLRVEMFPGKGRGIVATRVFQRNDFVVEYKGDLITYEEAKRREKEYDNQNKMEGYMYYFKRYVNQKEYQYCIDATKEPEVEYYGRLLNHSRKRPNCMTKLVEVFHPDSEEIVPHLILIAKMTIRPGEELLYDYGDTNSDSIEANPWLKNT